MSTPPDHLKKLIADLDKADEETAKRRQLLELDTVFSYESKFKGYIGKVFRFRKLRYREWSILQSMSPEIPEGTITVTKEQNDAVFEVACTGLAMASVDEFKRPEWRDMPQPLVLDMFRWLSDVSGISQEAIETLDWFRKQ